MSMTDPSGSVTRPLQIGEAISVSTPAPEASEPATLEGMWQRCASDISRALGVEDGTVTVRSWNEVACLMEPGNLAGVLLTTLVDWRSDEFVVVDDPAARVCRDAASLRHVLDDRDAGWKMGRTLQKVTWFGFAAVFSLLGALVATTLLVSATAAAVTIATVVVSLYVLSKVNRMAIQPPGAIARLIHRI